MVLGRRRRRAPEAERTPLRAQCDRAVGCLGPIATTPSSQRAGAPPVAAAWRIFRAPAARRPAQAAAPAAATTHHCGPAGAKPKKRSPPRPRATASEDAPPVRRRRRCYQHLVQAGVISHATTTLLGRVSIYRSRLATYQKVSAHAYASNALCMLPSSLALGALDE